MIESLVCLAQRMQYHGVKTPLLELKHAYEYGSLIEAKNHLLQIGERDPGRRAWAAILIPSSSVWPGTETSPRAARKSSTACR